MAKKVTKINPEELLGKLMRWVFIIGAIFIVFKYYKSSGFWWGVFAVVLAIAYMETNKGFFKIGLFSDLSLSLGKQPPESPIVTYELQNGKCYEVPYAPLIGNQNNATPPEPIYTNEVDMCNCNETC